ncbi:MAG: hypothetical protein E6G64_16815 [Actinobacteria bacterium]|nr:MAG: hypothetical protein E6G64_16815 [Actinomycetota bacterium]
MDLKLLTRLLREVVHSSGVGRDAVAAISTASPSPERISTALRRLFDELEQSPVPEHGTTPDEVAERLHFLALVVADLAGSYNEFGIRRWFARPRPQLDGRSPSHLLRGNWRSDQPGPQRVRELARALTGSLAT